jgi:O-antigen/teichoic acid export membrane protein
LAVTQQGEAATVARRTFKSDVAFMLAAKLVVIVTGVATSAIVARELGAEGRGAVAVAISFALLLTQFGTLGLNSANAYFVAREPALRGSIALGSLVLAIALAAVLAACGLLVRLLVPSILEGVSGTDLAVVLGAIPAALAAQFLQAVLLGADRTIAYNAVDAGAAVVTLAAVVVALPVLGGGVTVAISVLVGGRVLAALAYAVLLRSDLRVADRVNVALVRRLLRYGAKAYLAAMLAYLVIRLDLLLVNAYLGPEQAGYYAVAVALADGLNLIPAVIAVNLFARVARGLDQQASAQVFRAVVILYGAICLVAVAAAPLFVRLVYGSAFEEAVMLFIWLAPGIFCLGLLNILAQHFAGRGFPIEAALVWFLGLGVNLAVNFLFLESGGTVVASIASTAAYALLLVLHMRMFARDIGGYGPLRPRLGEALALTRSSLRRVQPPSTT